MDTKELRSNLLEEIAAIEDIAVLKKIKQVLSEVAKSKEGLYLLSEQQLEILNESLEQYKSGQFLTAEEAEKDLEKWFEEEEKLFGQ